MTDADKRSAKALIVVAAVFVALVIGAWAVNVWVHS